MTISYTTALISPAISVTICIAFLSLVSFIAFLFIKYKKQRTEKFKQAADDLGLSFFPKGKRSFRDQLKHLQLFSNNSFERIKNLSHGEINNVEIAVFDYKHGTRRVGRGSDQTDRKESIIFFRSSDLNLPNFALSEAFQIFQQFVGVIGYEDINFESHPTFSKKYLLNCNNESALRQLFNDELISFLEGKNGINVEGCEDQLIFYRSEEPIKPEEVRQFMQEGFEIFKQFRRASMATF